MNLLIDDVRNYNYDVIARTSHAGEELLAKCDWELLAIDNDLGYGQKEGWRILDWALQAGRCPKKVQIVTSNPPARLRMEGALIAHGYESCRGTWVKEYECEENAS